jgi:hypothetical protein
MAPPSEEPRLAQLVDIGANSGGGEAFVSPSDDASRSALALSENISDRAASGVQPNVQPTLNPALQDADGEVRVRLPDASQRRLAPSEARPVLRARMPDSVASSEPEPTFAARSSDENWRSQPVADLLRYDAQAPIQTSVEAPVEAPIQAQAEAQSFGAQPDAAADPTQQRAQSASAHNLMWLAALAHVPVPDHILAALDASHGASSANGARADGRANLAVSPGGGPPTGLGQQAASSESEGSGFLGRLSVDGWLFLRQDGPSQAQALAQAAAGPNAASYGRSQAGLVARYDLAPASSFQPRVFVRATSALSGISQSDLALGLSARPLAGLPVTAHIEGRFSQDSGSTQIRPAAFVTTGGQRENLPLGLRLSGYAQAGYVGGDFATAFADGNLVATREVSQFDLGRFGNGKLRAGAGVWGGAQRGANRLDVGPSANLAVKLGELPAQVSLDYRFRVAGKAEPGSGVALTISTGF